MEILIPEKVLALKDLTMEEKLCFSIIIDKCKNGSSCILSNNDFVKLIGKGYRSIPRYIGSLEQKEYITIKRASNLRFIGVNNGKYRI